MCEKCDHSCRSFLCNFFMTATNCDTFVAALRNCFFIEQLGDYGIFTIIFYKVIENFMFCP